MQTGADDYITKPFEQAELLARIDTVLRRTRHHVTNRQSKTVASFAGWKLNLINHTLSSPDGDQVELTGSEYHLLFALISNANSAITRDDILNAISGRAWSPMDRSADMAISKLRKKIEPNPHSPMLIKTIRNKGYQFTANVEYLD